jgi:putative peptidoglycan lipid II flippase
MIKQLFVNGKKIFSKQQSSIFSAASVLALAFGLSAFLGILRDRSLYAKFYACCAPQLDAYNAAFRLPDLVFRLLVIGALSASFIPVFSSQLDKDKKTAYQVASTVVNVLLAVFLGVSVLIFIFSKPLSSVIASGFSPEQTILMAQLTRWMIGAQVFFLLSNFLTGILQAQQRFLVPALAPLIYNLSIIGAVEWMSGQWGIFAPAFGVLIGAFLHFLIQVPLALSLGLKYFPQVSFKLKGVKKILELMPPRALSLGLGEIRETVILFVGSGLAAGSLSLFYLGQRLTRFFVRLFGTTIGQASLPVLSKEAEQKSLNNFSNTLFSSLKQALYLAFPAAAIFLVLRIPVVRLAYGAQEFPWQATIRTGKVIAFLAPIVVLGAVNDILVRSFYALRDTRTPLKISFLSLVVNTLIAFLGVYQWNWSVFALALASSMASLAQSVFLFIVLFKRIKVKKWGETFVHPVKKIVMSSIFAACLSWLLLRGLDTFVFNTARLAGLIGLTTISGGLAVVFYFALTLVWDLKEAKAIWKWLRKTFSLPKLTTSPVELPPQVD